MIRRNRILSRLAIVGGSIALLFAHSGSAQAHAYDGTDPSATGCSSSGRTVASAALTNRPGNSLGTIELRFSSSCKTAWARITLRLQQWDCGSAAGLACSKAWVVRNNDGRTYSCTVYTGQTQCYTPQVYDYDPNTSYARGLSDAATGVADVRTSSY
ncbi:DUF2690 domain-containing protein [Streptomyces hebeiensis]